MHILGFTSNGNGIDSMCIIVWQGSAEDLAMVGDEKKRQVAEVQEQEADIALGERLRSSSSGMEEAP